MKITRSHELDKRALRERLDGELAGLLARFGEAVSDIERAWEGDVARFSFRARGLKVTGSLLVSDAQVALDLQLPWAARLFESTIRSKVEQELDGFLDRQRQQS